MPYAKISTVPMAPPPLFWSLMTEVSNFTLKMALALPAWASAFILNTASRLARSIGATADKLTSRAARDEK